MRTMRDWRLALALAGTVVVACDGARDEPPELASGSSLQTPQGETDQGQARDAPQRDASRAASTETGWASAASAPWALHDAGVAFVPNDASFDPVGPGDAASNDAAPIDAPPVRPPPPVQTPIDPASQVLLDDGSCAALNGARVLPFEPDSRFLTLRVLAALDAARAELIGSWVGEAEAPEGWLPSRWLVKLQLRADRTYSASSYSADVPEVSAFNNGSDQCEVKHWEVDSIGTKGLSGSIEVPFWYGPGDCSLPGWDGVLDSILLSASGNRLRFDFRTSQGYGPIHYDLFRSCPPPAP